MNGEMWWSDFGDEEKQQSEEECDGRKGNATYIVIERSCDLTIEYETETNGDVGKRSDADTWTLSVLP